MIEHHIQRAIIRSLLPVAEASFSQLKPDTIDSNGFSYHLQQLIKQQYVEKLSSGAYSLTAAGKTYAITSHLRASELYEQAHSILLLVVRDAAGRWLLRERRMQPMLGKIGFLHGEPEAHQSIMNTARQRLRDKTGLDGTFHTRGSGFVRLLRGGAVESFTHFTLLETDDASGELSGSDETGQNIWYDELQYDPATMIPSMKDLLEALSRDQAFFLDLSYEV